MRLSRVTASRTESSLSCILDFKTKLGRKSSLTVVENVRVAKDMVTLDVEKEECKQITNNPTTTTTTTTSTTTTSTGDT